MTNRELTYDRITNLINNILREPRPPSISEERINGAQEVLRVLNESKIFWIDEMTLDSLINHPCSVEDFERFEFRLPFPVMFFDLSTPIDYRFLEDRVKDTGFKIGGLLVNDTRGGYMNDRTRERGISVRGYRADSGVPAVKTTFLEERPFYIIEYPLKNVEGGLSCDLNYYVLYPHERRLAKVNLGPEDTYHLSQEEIENRIEFARDFHIQDDDCLDAFKIVNLAVNTINYVNAQNIVIREQRRTTRRRVRTRRTRRRNVEVELRPYYWIEVKKSYIDRERREGEPEWSVNCRFWVRGHNRSFRDENARERYHIWIEPYVKGPEDAPWKNNRYEILWKRFRPLFEHPELRRGPWAMQEIQRELNDIRRDEGR